MLYILVFLALLVLITKNFQENHTDDIWNAPLAVGSKITFPGETSEFGLGPQWAEEYLEQSIENAESITVSGTDNLAQENPNFAYSKFMKFMRQENDNPVETVPISKTEETLDNKWSSEFIKNEDDKEKLIDSADAKTESNILSAVDEQNAAAGSWVNEFTNDNTTEGKIMNIFYLILYFLTLFTVNSSRLRKL